MINPMKLMKIKNSWETFIQNHPRFPLFISALKQSYQDGNPAITEGTVIDLNITMPDGRTMATNVKLTESDLELFREIVEMSK